MNLSELYGKKVVIEAIDKQVLEEPLETMSNQKIMKITRKVLFSTP